MSEKDTFQILADEITLIRGEIKQLQRSSLNKDEAKALNQQLVQGVDSMAQTGQAVYEAISERMDLRLEKLAIETILAAKDAAASGDSSDLIYETADLWFHSLVMLAALGQHPQAVLDELDRRFGLSGHAEKAARPQT